MSHGKRPVAGAAPDRQTGDLTWPAAAAASICALVAETIAVDLALDGGNWVLAGLAIHLFAVLGLGGWVLLLSRAARDLRFPVLLVSSTAVLGPVGPVGVLLVILLHRWYMRSATTFESWYASLFPEEAESAESSLNRQLRSGGDGTAVDVVPFMDILSFGSRQQKQSMIALITSRFQPAFAPVLRLALNDTNNAIRVQAATAMTRVENGFLEQSMRLTAAAARHPRDASTVLDLARHYDAYAFAGILDDERERENREKAASAYRAYLELRPDDLSARAGLGRILVRKKEYQQAIEVLRVAIDAGVHSPQIVLWGMESLYRLGMYDRLRQLARDYRPEADASGGVPAEVSEALALWAATGPVGDPSEVPAA